MLLTGPDPVRYHRPVANVVDHLGIMKSPCILTHETVVWQSYPNFEETFLWSAENGRWPGGACSQARWDS